MFFLELLFAIVIALLLTWIFGIGLRRDNRDFLLFFIIMILIIWAGGIWITPVGPLLWGVPWLSFLLVGLLFMLLFVAVIPENRYRKRRTEAAERETVFIVDVFFWILIIGIGIAILTYYL
ncbi:MAG: hypothetical protein ACLFPF_01340 [Halanaerobiales bacterium]